MPATPTRATVPVPRLSDGVLKAVLPNGLTVLVKAVHSAPVVAVNAWVRAGSVTEGPRERGISHFIEHMLFKGTAKLGVGELDRRIRAAGGYNNAHTRYESTDFIDILPSDRLAVGLETMADALSASSFDAAELDRERQVVLEELSRAQDHPGFEAWNRLTHLAFKRHPYRHPVIGYKAVLEGMDRSLLVDYWRRWYRPSNITVVVVGDVDPQAALRQVRAAFGRWRLPKVAPAPCPRDGAPQGLRFEEGSGAFEGTMLVLGVPTCAELDADAPALDMGLAILGQGLSSRLNLEVRERRRLVHTVTAGQFSGAHPGLAYLWAELEPAKIPHALRAIWAEVERMRRQPVDPEELDRQKVRLEHDEASEAMSMEGMAGKLGYYETLASDYRLADRDADRMRAVSPEDVRRVMERYFRVEALNVVVHRGAKSPATGLRAASVAALLQEPAIAPAARRRAGRREPELRRFRLSGGGTLLVKRVRHAPLVALQAAYASGQWVEGPSAAGGLNLLARTLFKGVPGLDAGAVAKAMDALGLAVGAAADPDRFSLSLQALSSRLAPSLALASRCLREAELPDAEVVKERARVLKDLRERTDAPDEYAADLYQELHFGPRHPYARPLEGTPKSVAALRRATLAGLKRRVLGPANLLAVAVGDAEPEALRDLVEAGFGGRDAAAGRPPALPKAPAVPDGARRREVRLPGKKQAQLILGWPSPPVTHPDYPALRLVNSILGEGMDSRLFTEVRDKRGLCYTVHSSFDRRLCPGAWRIYVGTRPETLDQAEAVCREVAGTLKAKGVTAGELAAAKAYAKGIFRVARQDFSTDARVLLNYEFWGLGAAEAERVPARLDAVTLKDCARVLERWLRPEVARVVVVRP